MYKVNIMSLFKHWNFRVIKFSDGTYSIREVYYNRKDEPIAVSEKDHDLGGCVSVNEIRKEMNWIVKCLDKPALFYEDFTKK